MIEIKTPAQYDAIQGANKLKKVCHNAAYNAGWWKDNNGVDIRDNPLNIPKCLLLAISELCEAMEGHRTGVQDKHLPEFTALEVELADAVIRIFDTAGGYDLRIAEALVAKMHYNATRQDHKIESRKAVGGKAY